MTAILHERNLTLDSLNALARNHPEEWIAGEERRYTDKVEEMADYLTAHYAHRCVALLSGPSASGKTTTAVNLERALKRRGRDAYTISLDNFYRGRGQAPRLPDGSLDYESIEALNLPLLQRCMKELIEDGSTSLPVFDFVAGEPEATRRPLDIGDNSFVIFEGIHALNPLLEEHLSGNNRFKIYINTMTPVYDGEEKVLSRKDIRLMRRTLRDVRFRNSSPENTMDMWRQVIRGEKLYLFPYVDTADAVFDTMHAYEPAMLGHVLIPLLKAIDDDSPFAETARRLTGVLSQLEPLPLSMLPADSLLREFLGDI